MESADEDIPDAMFKESCITEQTQYFFDNDERSYSGVLDCGNCSRYVHLPSREFMCMDVFSKYSTSVLLSIRIVTGLCH